MALALHQIPRCKTINSKPLQKEEEDNCKQGGETIKIKVMSSLMRTRLWIRGTSSAAVLLLWSTLAWASLERAA